MTCIKEKMTVKELREKTLMIVIALFMLYALWFQQIFFAISGAFTLFGLAFVALIIVDIRNFSLFKELYGMYLFTFIITLETFLTSQYKNVALQMLISHFKYILPMVTIFAYINGNLHKMNKVLIMISLSVSLLAMGSFIVPVVWDTGAISVGTLSTNEYAGYLMLGLMCELILFFQKKQKKSLYCVLIIAIVVNFVAQILTASRRGFIVHVFILVFMILVWLRIKFIGRPLTRFALILLIMCLACICLSFFSDQLSDTALFYRFFGEKSDAIAGDKTRDTLQKGALTLFKEDPIFGGGLNSLTASIGVYSHSMYYELLGCTGIMGVIPIAWFFIDNIIFFASRLRSSKRRSDYQTSYMAMNGLIFTIAILITGYAVVLIYDMYFYVMVAVVASMRKCMSRTQRQCSDTQTRVDMPVYPF